MRHLIFITRGKKKINFPSVRIVQDLSVEFDVEISGVS